MSVHFRIFRPAAARPILLCGGVVGCLAVSPAPGRPIEFSDPTSSNGIADVSDLGVKSADLPGVDDRVFKPHVYGLPRDMSFNMRPTAAQSALMNTRPNPVPGLFDREKDWMELTPDQTIQKMLNRDSLKLPSFDTGNNVSDPWSRNAPLTLRRDAAKSDAPNRPRETSRPENLPAGLKENDPFAAYSGRNAYPGSLPVLDLNEARAQGLSDLSHPGNELSPEALREQKEMADHLDEFKRTLNFQTPVVNPAFTPVPRGNSYITEVENPSRSPAEKANPLFATPAAPLAPRAPVAPGQPSLTPSVYKPPAKIKPVVVTVPRRSF